MVRITGNRLPCQKGTGQMIIGPKRIDAAIEEASKCFWSEIEKQFPEIKDGDLDPGTVIVLHWQMNDAVVRWVQIKLARQEEQEPELTGKEYQAKVNEANAKWYKPKTWLGES